MHASLVHSPSSALYSLLLLVGSSSCSHSWWKPHSHCLNGLSAATSRNSERLCLHVWSLKMCSKVSFLSLCAKWPLKACITSIPLFFRRAPGLLFHTSLSHLTMSSAVMCPSSSNLNVILLASFPYRRFFLFRVTSGVSVLPTPRTDSITVSLFSCAIISTTTDFDPFALVVFVVCISNKARYLFHKASGVTSDKLTGEGVTSSIKSSFTKSFYQTCCHSPPQRLVRQVR